jgi:pimeloyl-ACP methyl ester carboxylesterase
MRAVLQRRQRGSLDRGELQLGVTVSTVAMTDKEPRVCHTVTLPSLLLVPGAWHRPDHLRLLVDELSGLDVHSVSLVSSGADPAALGDMYADANVIEAAAAAIGGPLVVVAHSYGGIPTTQALGELSNVRRIVYLAAFQIGAGESLFSINGGAPMAWSKVHQNDGIGGYLEAMTPVEIFYDDVDPVIARQAVSRLGYLSYAAGLQKLTKVAWETVPSTYVVCESDKAILPSLQEVFAQRAERVHRLNASHSPFLSQPAALAQLI